MPFAGTMPWLPPPEDVPVSGFAFLSQHVISRNRPPFASLRMKVDSLRCFLFLPQAGLIVPFSGLLFFPFENARVCDLVRLQQQDGSAFQRTL